METAANTRKRSRQFRVTVQHGGYSSILHGSASENTARREREISEIERMVRKFALRIMSARLLNTLKITVKVRATGMDSSRGRAWYAKPGDASRKNYTIKLARDDFGPDTIAHELAHVAQYAKGRLRHGSKAGEAGRFWRDGAGRATFHPYATTDYWTSPWEVEAREVAAKVAP